MNSIATKKLDSIKFEEQEEHFRIRQIIESTGLYSLLKSTEKLTDEEFDKEFTVLHKVANITE